MKGTVAIVSPYFPPSAFAGVHRARHLVKHLPGAGWTPIVICVAERFHEERLDPALAALVPRDANVKQVTALSAHYTRPFGLGDISVRAWLPLKRVLFRLLASRQVDVVLITGAPYYPMLLARNIRQHFGTPVVLDFQDPWVSAWGRNQPGLSKAGISHRLGKWLEPRAIRHASFITSVSERQNSELADRYPWLNREHMHAIPIGGDPDDFIAMRATGSVELDELFEPNLINISYVGTYWPAAEKTVRALLRGYSRLRSREPRVAARIRFNFIGTNANPNGVLTRCVEEIAFEEGVSEAVREVSRRLPYLQALAAMNRSHGLVLVGSHEPHYTASKIYPALMSGRPYLSLFHRASSAHAILSSAGGGLTFAFSNQSELDALEVSLAEGIRTLAISPISIGRATPLSYAPFEAGAIAAAFGRIFEKVAQNPAQ
jgi:glycosyltransferase involved in cell wall biosynthesis